MQGRLKLITAPAVEPVTTDEVKLHTRIDGNTETTLLSSWITSARILAEQYQRRAYITQTWELILDGWPGMPISIPRSPVQSVTSLKYYDTANTETSWDLSNLLIVTDTEPGRITLAYGITYPSTTLREMNSVVIRYVAGYGDAASDVPENVKDAIHLYCAYRYENRTAEIESVPVQFYDLLRPERVYL
jgi:uncharacterized phiE125 gp8 family phage protein